MEGVHQKLVDIKNKNICAAMRRHSAQPDRNRRNNAERCTVTIINLRDWQRLRFRKKRVSVRRIHADDAPTSYDLKNAQRVQGYNVHR